jgi:homogentisate 1,2-dioxygenase
MSLHNSMVPHGPDADAYSAASNATLAPHKLDDTLAFMFESRWRFHPTAFAMHEAPLDTEYAQVWSTLADHFKRS